MLAGRVQAQLYWKTPEIHAKEAVIEPREKTRSVYLPAGSSWIDFWTGEKLDGGRTSVADAPIEKIPLMVKAGSIVPMGPFIQYSTEKPADPIELRIYPGADGSFTLYEDENDNYDYEKGVYATTIAFHWDDAKRQLTIDARKGTTDLSISVACGLRWPNVPETQCGGHCANSASFSAWASVVEITTIPREAACRLSRATASMTRSAPGA
jgi:hypothetical protein